MRALGDNRAATAASPPEVFPTVATSTVSSLRGLSVVFSFFLSFFVPRIVVKIFLLLPNLHPLCAVFFRLVLSVLTRVSHRTAAGVRGGLI